MLGIGACNPLIMHLFRAWIAIPRLLGYIINCVSIRNVFGKVFIAMEGFYNMISYVRQVPICQSVRKAIEESFTESGDASFRAKIGDIPTVESILRAVSLYPNLNNAEELRTFMVKHILSDLRLTKDQQQQFFMKNNDASSD